MPGKRAARRKRGAMKARPFATNKTRRLRRLTHTPRKTAIHGDEPPRDGKSADCADGPVRGARFARRRAAAGKKRPPRKQNLKQKHPPVLPGGCARFCGNFCFLSGALGFRRAFYANRGAVFWTKTKNQQKRQAFLLIYA